jgi:maltose O-acetyltransferase
VSTIERAVGTRYDAGEEAEGATRAGRWSRVAGYLAAQRTMFHGRLAVAQLVERLVPFSTFGRLRGALYRLAGFGIAPGVRLAGPLTIWGTGDVYGRLTVGERTFLNSPAHIELNAPVEIGARCGIGHHLVLITSNHVMGPSSARMGALRSGPIRIGNGVWIGACVTVLPNVVIGDGAFVAAGAVVTRDVPPNARVAGNPAVVVGMLDDAAPTPRRPRGDAPVAPLALHASA